MLPEVAAAFSAAPLEARSGMLALRTLILKVAANLGPVTEVLRWGDPAYLVPGGSLVRIGAPKAGGFALYCHCRTSLIADFRDIAGEGFRYQGNRAVLFDRPEDIDAVLIEALVARALTWHRRRDRPETAAPRTMGSGRASSHLPRGASPPLMRGSGILCGLPGLRASVGERCPFRGRFVNDS